MIVLPNLIKNCLDINKKNSDVLKKRKSNIELLKIIAIILITIQHCITSCKIQTGLISNNSKSVFLILFRYIGLIGNNIFIICSSYFLVDSKKNNKQKIINILADSFVISLLWFIPCIVFNIKLTGNDIFKELFPVSSGNNWFIACYIILYLIYPILNKLIDNISQITLLRIVIALAFMYAFIQFFLSGKLGYTNLLLFVFLYLLVAYLKKYKKKCCNNKKLNFIILFISIIMYIAFIIIPNYLALYNENARKAMIVIGIKPSNSVIYWSRNMFNPFGILIAVSLFNIINSSKVFYNKAINYLSSCSLVYYLIHENRLFREKIRPNLFVEFNNDHRYQWIILMFVLVLIGGMILAIIYKITFQKTVHRISNLIYKLIRTVYLKLEEKIIRE